MMQPKITIEKSFEISKVDKRLFSSFIEHLGRAVYTGIYEPGHPLADEQGFRKDVIELVRDLNVTLVRYPGGNFLSGYNWWDGIGDKSKRPVRLDLAWHSIETNEIGIDEFVDWCKKANTEVMGAVNMGTGTPQEAAYLVEYCNHPGGTYWSDKRIENGHKDPHNIKTWCIGNEMDGPWQICHLDAVDYGKKALETAKMMRWVDHGLELVVCGSASSNMPTYPEWDRIVLEHTYNEVDFLSLHRYYENDGKNDLDFLASFMDMDAFIRSVCATADYVKALKRSKKTMMLSFDEWNVWYQSHQSPHPWMQAPALIEDKYSLLDALVFGGLAITLINNSDRVKIACLAQLVNAIAPILTQAGGNVIKQTTYYPFRDISMLAKGTVLRPVVVADRAQTRYGDAPLIHTCAVYNEEENKVSLFCLNIADKPQKLDLDMRSFGKSVLKSHTSLGGEALDTKNTFEQPNAVVPHNMSIGGEIILPALSWNVLTFDVE